MSDEKTENPNKSSEIKVNKRRLPKEKPGKYLKDMTPEERAAFDKECADAIGRIAGKLHIPGPDEWEGQT